MLIRIAQVAPLFESVPPKLYGGTERVVSWLTEELVRLGHYVTLFASGDSMTTAKLVPVCPESLRLAAGSVDHLPHHLLLLEEVLRHKNEFDVIHFHIDYLHYPFSKRERYTHLTTLHGRLDLPDIVPLYEVYRDMPVVSISDSQREPLPNLNWQGTVHHGLPEKNYSFHRKSGKYLAFLGRTSPEKGLDRAIEIAKRAGMPLKVAAKIDKVDQEYFETCIQPLLKESDVEFVGEVGYPHKSEFLGDAAALLFPVAWPEPFGLVMIEAMACGTPVIAYEAGSVSEVMEDGVTGFIVDNIEQAVEAVGRIPEISRASCREIFEKRFTASRMASDHINVYMRLADTRMRKVAQSLESSLRAVHSA